MDDNFKILFGVAIDNSSLSDAQKQIAKEYFEANLSLDIDINSFAKNKAEVAKKVDEMSKHIQKAFKAINVDLDLEQSMGMAMDYFKLIEKSVKAQDKLNKSQKASTLKEQEKYYKRIIENNEEIYRLKKLQLTAGEEENKVLSKQIKNAQQRNRRTYEAIAQKGLGSTEWGQKVYRAEENLKAGITLKKSHELDRKNAKAEADEKRSRTDKAMSLLSKEKQAYQEIWDIRTKISKLDPDKDKNEIAALNESKKAQQEIYLSLQKQLGEYDDIISKEERLKTLSEIRSKAKQEMSVISGRYKDDEYSNQENNRSKALKFTKSESKRLSSAIEKYSYGDTTEATEKLSRLGDGVANFKDLDSVDDTISRISDEVDKIIADLKKSHEENLKALKTAIKEEEKASKEIDPSVKNGAYSTQVDKLEKEFQKYGLSADDAKEKVKQLRKHITEMQNSSDDKSLISNFEKFKQELKDVNVQLEQAKLNYDKITKDKISDIQRSINVGDYSKDLSKIEANFKKIGNFTLADGDNKTLFKAASDSYKSLLDVHKQLKAAMADQNVSDQQKIALEEQYQQTLATTKNLLAQINVSKDDENMAIGDNRRVNMIATLNNYLAKNTAMTKESKKQIEIWIETLGSSDDLTVGALKNINSQFKQLDSTLRKSGKLGLSNIDKFKQAAEKFGGWSLVTGAITRGTTEITKAVTELKEIDDILTEISKTSDLTEKQLKKLGNTSLDTASKYGKKASDYLVGVQEMYRAGFDNADEMAELSVLAQAAGDMEKNSANDYLMATNAAYDYKGSVEDLNKVLDSQNYITNNAAVSMQDMADATSEAASIAAQYGVEVDELSALIAVATSKTRESGAEVGTALKALLINLQDTTSKPIRSAFEGVGISMTKIVDGSEQLKTPIELIKELSVAFNSLPEGDVKRANILNDIGGKHHANTLAAILSDLESYNSMLELYNNNAADGSAFKEAEKSANNWSGSVNKLSNSWTSLVQNFANSDTIIYCINLLNDLVKTIDKLGAIGTIGLGAGIFAGFKNVGRDKMLSLMF